jgi:arginine N-succinyltransferase
VGDPSLPAARILQKIGFVYMQQIEPFDGGPYYGALTRSLKPIRHAVQVQARLAAAGSGARPCLLLSESSGHARGLVAPAVLRGPTAFLSGSAMKALGLRAGDWLWATPFHP